MENLNAEQIKKALERLGDGVPNPCPNCLALRSFIAFLKAPDEKIKELTEENERLRDIEKIANFYQAEASRLAQQSMGG